MKDMFTPPPLDEQDGWFKEKNNGSQLSYINFIPPEEDEEEFWEEVLAARPRRSFKTVLKVVLIVSLIIVMFGYAALLQHGRGLIRSLFPARHGMSFTLPVAETPELDGKYMNEDGSYNSAGLAKAVLPSVVQIRSYTSGAVTASSQGSGIIMSEDGYIVTNAHVVSGADFGITVMLYDKTEYAAQLVGKDDPTDIAVLKISAPKLTPAQFADSDKCELGEEVVAIGSPAGFENSVTKGIISGLDRSIRAENSVVPMQCIQIDAAINPGNSGGPLFNMWGQVIGITSSKLVAASYDNIGFAITISSAKPVIEELIESGYVPDRGRVGILYNAVSEEAAKQRGWTAGLYVVEIDEECNIAATDLTAGDIITEMDGTPVSTQQAVNDVLSHFKAGDAITCKVFRPAPDKDGDGTADGDGEYFEITFELNSAKTAMIEDPQ